MVDMGDRGTRKKKHACLHLATIDPNQLTHTYINAYKQTSVQRISFLHAYCLCKVPCIQSGSAATSTNAHFVFYLLSNEENVHVFTVQRQEGMFYSCRTDRLCKLLLEEPWC